MVWWHYHRRIIQQLIINPSLCHFIIEQLPQSSPGLRLLYGVSCHERSASNEIRFWLNWDTLYIYSKFCKIEAINVQACGRVSCHTWIIAYASLEIEKNLRDRGHAARLSRATIYHAHLQFIRLPDVLSCGAQGWAGPSNTEPLFAELWWFWWIISFLRHYGYWLFGSEAYPECARAWWPNLDIVELNRATHS